MRQKLKSVPPILKSFLFILLFGFIHLGCSAQSNKEAPQNEVFQEALSKLDALISDLEKASSPEEKEQILFKTSKINRQLQHQIKVQQQQLHHKNLTILQNICGLEQKVKTDSLLLTTVKELRGQYNQQFQEAHQQYLVSKSLEKELKELQIANARAIEKYSGLQRALIILVIGVIILATINFLLKSFLPKRENVNS